ncbi:ArsR/SmtB family transcription factor [Anaerosporobacter faecicola]|uniref:ArsR/SmtB family transcription factor n=1 Tax=Anaerosporobacter faecicola TaxID=2718714 RepID=UPI00143A99FB|nr:metalloregulator ArsR/SmtB family transcription factor [Anaerosporobacter faecicola]
MTTKQLANIHKALSNENRLEIFHSILESEEKSFDSCPCLVSAIMDKLCIGAPTISHHLKELVNAGLIETMKDGKYLVAKVNYETVNALREELHVK